MLSVVKNLFKGRKDIPNKDWIGRIAIVCRNFRGDNMQYATGKIPGLAGQRQGLSKGRVELNGTVYKASASSEQALQELVVGRPVRIAEIWDQALLIELIPVE